MVAFQGVSCVFGNVTARAPTLVTLDGLQQLARVSGSLALPSPP
jgi:hypothetical protein